MRRSFSGTTGSGSPISDIDALRNSVFSEIEVLRKRIQILERESPGAKSALSVEGGSYRRQVVNPKSGAAAGARAQKGDALENEDAATTLEFFALGMDRRLGRSNEGLASRGASPQRTRILPSRWTSHITVDPSDRQIPDSITDALLPRPNVHSILTFAETHVLWQHCCVFFPGFWREVDAFWDAMSQEGGWNRIDPSWIALFYVLQGISVHQMTNADAAKCGLAEPDRYVLPNALVSAAEDALHLGQFLSRNCIYTVQAIAILAVCGRNVCESDLLSSLIAIGIKTAQSLGLHRLGKVSDQLSSGLRDKEGDKEGQRLIEVEIGKRVWWSLTQEDWFGIPFRGVWSIHPELFDTPLPNNCHDADILAGRYISCPDTVLTVATKQRFAPQVARVLQSLFQQLNTKEEALSASPFTLAQQAATKVQRLLASLPYCLQIAHTPSMSCSPALPPYTQAMRHYLHISANHKVIVAYRAFLARGGSPRERSIAHQACVSASETILAELERGSLEQDQIQIQSLWTIPYHSLAAAVVLALDMILLSGKPEANARRDSVMRAKVALERLAPTSRIARRGLQVLAELIKEADALADSAINGNGKRKTGSASMTKMIKKIKLPANEMIDPATPLPSPVSTVRAASSTSSDSSTYNIDALPGVPDWSETSSLHTVDGYLAPSTLNFSQAETNELLLSLQAAVPDVGRLFDGSIGNWTWG